MTDKYIGALGEFEQLVLLAVLRLNGEGYGITVQSEIEDRTGRSATLGAVYKALQRLEEKHLILGRMGEPTAERGGRRRRHYRLLPVGKKALQASLDALHQMATGTSVQRA